MDMDRLKYYVYINFGFRRIQVIQLRFHQSQDHMKRFGESVAVPTYFIQPVADWRFFQDRNFTTVL